jgi:hypothetical protein
MRRMMILAAAAVLGTGAVASAAIGFNVIANYNIEQANFALFNGQPNPSFIGSNTSAVAWDGVVAYVGGYNASGVAANTGVVAIDTTGGVPAFGTAFGQLSTVNLRGVVGLSRSGNNLAVATDFGGTPTSTNGDSVRLFNTTTNTLTWRIGTSALETTRRGNGGVDFDPGFNAAGPAQVSYLSQGSGRRHRLDTAAGTYINGQNAGAIVTFAGGTTGWRDQAYDVLTGDLYTRESNRIGKAVRTADNAFSGGASTNLVALTTATGVDNQNIEFLDSPFGKFVVVNDRSVTSAGQLATNVIKVFDTLGNAETIIWSGLPISASGTGAYDFSWHAPTQSLAITDFANRRLYIVNVPEPTALGVLAGLAPLALRRRRA